MENNVIFFRSFSIFFLFFCFAGHFTQMVWKSCREVGMGRAKSKTGRQIIVANYNPPGNFVGKYTENVPKPKQ